MTSTVAEQFHDLGDRYVKALFQFWPNLGSWAGLHEYDHLQPNLSAASIGSRIAAVQAQRQTLGALESKELSPQEAFDYRLLQSALDLELYQWLDEQEYRRNPMWYLRPLDLLHFLKRDYAPLDTRARAAIGYLQNTPSVFDAARENLIPNPPRPFVTVALDMFQGMLAFYDQDLEQIAAQIQTESLRAELERARGVARAAVQDFVQALREHYLPNASEDYAIGAEHFTRMLRAGELVNLPLETLLRVGESDLARNLTAAREVARQIDPNRSPAQVAGLLKHEHPSVDELIPSTRALLEEIRQFLIDREIISVPSEVRATVAETPAFYRWSFASMDTPGPFETIAKEAFYYITPPEKDWPPEKQEEWLSEFNYYNLKGVSVHEAYPGHYIHFLHVNQRAHGPLRQLLYSYAFSEGWAHYTEEMMIEAGYGDGDPKLRLAQLKEALVRNCRYVCAIKLHTQGMSVDEATKFFMDNAFMEETPARKEAMRGTFDPGYLNYTLGKLIIRKLRDDLQKREGKNFNLKRFHDDLLSYGAPPVPLVRAAMLGEADGAII